MVKYFTLEEAAKLLGISPDRLREMANKKEIRAFQDRGTLRFRAEDIQERKRSQGQGSDPELPIGESTAARGPASPSPAKRKTSAEALREEDDSDEVVLFDLDPAKATGPAGPASGRVLGSRSSARLTRANEDSDVRLALDGSDFPSEEDSKARGASKSASKKKLAKPDSDVKVEQEADSEVPLGSKKKKQALSDSDIRLELEELPSMAGRSGRKLDQLVTEEIDLDEEEAKPPPPPVKRKTRSKLSSQSATPVLPTSSPFELSEPDVNINPPTSAPKGKKLESDSSDFELIAFDSSKSPGSPAGGVPLDDEEVVLGGLTGGGGKSGINLDDPKDSGISLEGGGSDELEFELPPDSETRSTGSNLALEDPSSDFELSIQDPGDEVALPSESDFELTLDDPALAAKGKADSEFELSLDDAPVDQEPSDSEFELSVSESAAAAEGSSSEFELTLDADNEVAGLSLDAEESSDSEFELSLDESGDLAPVSDAEEKDIFEPTNFDVPALEDESGSEAVALEDSDTDLEESGDFDLSVDQEDLESGSEVVALEDGEEADEGAATVARPRAKKGKAVVVEEEPLEEAEDSPKRSRRRAPEPEEDDEELTAPVSEAGAQPWGPLPAILLFPTVLILFMVGLMSFELVQGMWGYHRPVKLTKPIIDTIARTFDDNLPKD